MSAVATAQTRPTEYDTEIIIVTHSGAFHPNQPLANIIRQGIQAGDQRPRRARKPSGRRTK